LIEIIIALMSNGVIENIGTQKNLESNLIGFMWKLSTTNF